MSYFKFQGCLIIGLHWITTEWTAWGLSLLRPRVIRLDKK